MFTDAPGKAAEHHCTTAQQAIARGDLVLASEALARALALDPRHAPSLNLLGFLALRDGRLDEAREAFRRAIEAAPENPIYRSNLALAEGGLPAAEPSAALAHAQRAVSLRPQDVAAWLNCAALLNQLQGSAAAIAALYEALVQCPEDPQLLHRLAQYLHESARLAEAVTHYHHALRVAPESVPVRIDLALAYQRLLRLDPALRLLDEALERAPDHPQALLNKGAALYHRRRFREAIALLERSLAIQPDEPRALTNLGMARIALGETDTAIGHFRRLLESHPDHAVGHSNLLLALNYSDRVGVAEIAAEARRYGERHPAPAPLAHDNVRDPERRLRVGLVGGDFRYHVVGMFLLGLLPKLDRSRLELVCYSMVDVPDPFTQRIQALAAGWVDARTLDDAALAARVRADRVDVLLDLAGHTADNRLTAFAHRPAPVQASWLGFPGTLGAPGIDHRLTDAMLDPPGEQGVSLEAPVRLRSFFCYAPPPDWGGALQVAGLPAAGNGCVTFGAFNSLSKLSPTTFDLWAAAMRAVPGSRLVARAKPFDDPAERDRFVAHLAERGVQPARIDPRPYLPDPAAHLRIYDQVDIHLDSHPYGGGTTSCDALWMGVPVLTLYGDRPCARLGASVLSQLGLEDWIARDVAQYARIAAEKTADLRALAALRAGMRARFVASPLHDAGAFAIEFEAALRGLWRDWCESGT
jgi:predicted O-linked N-acetylglucosamine transferase (SPINDLY family)